VENLSPSVVTIFTQGGLGSGVVYSADGLILTNEQPTGSAWKGQSKQATP
jgi:S1-C subfamily serine protease